MVQSYESAKASIKTFETSAGFLSVPVWIGKISVTIGFGIAFFESLTQLFALFLFGRLSTEESKLVAH
jgi:hypothetical protein